MDSLSDEIYFGIACLAVGLLVIGVIEGADRFGSYFSLADQRNPLLQQTRIQRLLFAQDLIRRVEKAESKSRIIPELLEEFTAQAEYLKPFDDIKSVYIEIKGVLYYLKGNQAASETMFRQAATYQDYTTYISSLARSWESSKSK